mmetsp:Transcript_16953/g.31187  ORF Transcript_16953/g.31187 Transcript_16953/m.31187 type:complete len:520 (-) Transcript_16953:151-1710(-)
MLPRLLSTTRRLSTRALAAAPLKVANGSPPSNFFAAAAMALTAAAAATAIAETTSVTKCDSMEDFRLKALTPLDGRYGSRVADLGDYFSEYALIKYRVMVEVEYFIELCSLLPQLQGKAGIDAANLESLRDVYRNFNTKDALEVKAIEAVTNHDVKAVEYFLKKHFDALGMGEHKEFIHFALTSQDVNNVAQPLMMKDAITNVYLPAIKKLTAELKAAALQWDSQPMLARTHGQPATPTRMGKEIMVFVERLEAQVAVLEGISLGCKMGGATGNCAAHSVAFPDIDWEEKLTKLTGRLGLVRPKYTTQIAHYDDVAEVCDCLSRVNTVLIDLCRDMWQYVALGYFTQTIKKNEVGSSAMPHKVNPIDFENGEGNFGVANALFGHLSAKLPISRLQRDLTDSTVLRNAGVPFGHSLIGIKSTSRGLGKMNLNAKALNKDLDANWAVVAEAVQTVLRREAYPQPYEALKELTRVPGGITESAIRDFVLGLKGISPSVRAELLAISPHNFTGKAFVKDHRTK